jgi:large subunit ribosomal protein L23
MKFSGDVILNPVLSEKANLDSEKNGRYTFRVKSNSSKPQIKFEIEKIYDVKVEKIWTSILPGKENRYGRFSSKSTRRKKCIVELRKGQKIELFKGI